MKPLPLLPLLALAAATLPALADQRGDNPDAQPSSPQEQLARFHVPPGFEVQLVAAEPDIQKPINLNFDAAGRLWVSGSEMYPWPASTDPNGKPIADFDKGWKSIVDGFRVGDAPQPAAEARDTVRVLSDFDATGRAQKITVFADKLNIPSGIQPLPHGSAAINAVYGLPSPFDPNPDMAKRGPIAERHLGKVPKGESAVVYSIPNIWLLTDWDGDGFAESRIPLYTGFGYTDTHGGSSSYIYWIDGWIYGTHGFRNHSEVTDRNGNVTVLDSGNTYRFRPDGSAFEIYTHGQTNPFGLAFDPLGNLFSADSHSKPVYMLVRGGFYEGIGKQHDGLGFAPRITDDDHGSSAIGGIAYYADDKWPEEFRGNLFNGNPVTQKINRDRLEWHGSTPQAIRMPDFLTCDDPWFRPVNLKLGPDGALYIADFYNPIIGHYEVPLTHPARDHTHGRIWRVVYRGNTAPAPAGGVSPVKSEPAPTKSGASLSESGASLSKSERSPVASEPSLSKSEASPAESVRPLLQRGGGEIKREASPAAGDRSLAAGGASPAGPGASLSTSEPTPGAAGAPLTADAAPPLAAPDLTALDAAALIKKLADPSLEVRRLATNELIQRDPRQSARPLFEAANKTDDTITPQRWESGNGKGLARSGPLEIGPISAGRISALWALHRLAALDREMLKRFVQNPSPAVRTYAMRVLAERSDFDTEMWGWTHVGGDPSVAKASAETLSVYPNANNVQPLLAVLDAAPADDPELIYATRVSLRDQLLIPETLRATKYLLITRPEWGERIADVYLGCKTAEAADFLLAYLTLTKLEPARAGEYLKHVQLYLPEEQFDAIAKLITPIKNTPLPKRLALAGNLSDAARQRGVAVPEAIATWSQDVLLEALVSNNDDLTKPAIAAVRELPLEAKLAPLEKIARDESRNDALRLAALEAVANLPASHDLLAATFADPRHLPLRKRAAELLVQHGDSAAVLAVLPQAPWELALSISAALARNDAGALALLDAVAAGKAPARVLINRAVTGALFSRPKELQDRAKALSKDLPPEDARLDQVIAQRAESFRNEPRRVDALQHGAEVFQQQCAVCHRFRNAGGSVGPNLDGAGARGPQRLIEDILDPNRNVDPGFRQTVVETTAGQTLVGTNLRDSGNATDTIALTDATGIELLIPKATIKTRTTLNVSMMPPIFETQLPASDLNDLLSYLLAPH